MVVHGHGQDQHRPPAPAKLTSETPFHRPQIPVVLRVVATTDRFNALTKSAARLRDAGDRVFSAVKDARIEFSLREAEMDTPTPARQTEAKAQPPEDRTSPSARVSSMIVGVVIAAVAGLSVWYLVRPQPLLVQGEADATRFDIAARVDGRVAEIPVNEGQDVAAGAVLVRIDNPETIAKKSRRWPPRPLPRRNSPTLMSAHAPRSSRHARLRSSVRRRAWC